MSEQWIEIRHQLHTIAELSNQEIKTSSAVKELLEKYCPDSIQCNVGGYGVLALYEGSKPGPTTLIRAELDALPINETTPLNYASQHAGCAHKCGHDGHMSIVLSLAKSLFNHRPTAGKVVLAFQSAEETGEGALQMVKDPNFSPYMPDFAFALHNYPGWPLGKVGIKSGTFNCASKGMIISLQGKTSHAAYPEHGNSPALVMCDAIKFCQSVAHEFKHPVWCTVIHAKLGEVAFGTSPGDATVMLTLRSETNETMSELENAITAKVTELCNDASLDHSFEFQDEFRATVNTEDAVQLVLDACRDISIPTEKLENPMRWSEDFGIFTEVAKEGALFVIGSGEDSPQLHHPDYDFPDSLLTRGHDIFHSIIKKLNY